MDYFYQFPGYIKTEKNTISGASKQTGPSCPAFAIRQNCSSEVPSTDYTIAYCWTRAETSRLRRAWGSSPEASEGRFKMQHFSCARRTKAYTSNSQTIKPSSAANMRFRYRILHLVRSRLKNVRGSRAARVPVSKAELFRWNCRETRAETIFGQHTEQKPEWRMAVGMELERYTHTPQARYTSREIYRTTSFLCNVWCVRTPDEWVYVTTLLST